MSTDVEEQKVFQKEQVVSRVGVGKAGNSSCVCRAIWKGGRLQRIMNDRSACPVPCLPDNVQDGLPSPSRHGVNSISFAVSQSVVFIHK